MLEKIAKVLKASPDAIKSFAEENIVFHIQNMNNNSQPDTSGTIHLFLFFIVLLPDKLPTTGGEKIILL